MTAHNLYQLLRSMLEASMMSPSSMASWTIYSTRTFLLLVSLKLLSMKHLLHACSRIDALCATPLFLIAPIGTITLMIVIQASASFSNHLSLDMFKKSLDIWVVSSQLTSFFPQES